MLRKIIEIDQDKCIGCRLCINACQEGAIDIVDGKARLVREDFCDGLGNCLPECPTGAISFIEKEVPTYDEKAVLAKKAQGHTKDQGCPGSRSMDLGRAQGPGLGLDPEAPANQIQKSRLGQWPCQIKLVASQADFFDGARLLIAADCAAYAYASIHEDFMKGKITLIGCPKLDGVDYTDKLEEIISSNDIKEVTIIRMEVPCCSGLEIAGKNALRASGKFIPWQVVTISRDGRILD